MTQLSKEEIDVLSLIDSKPNLRTGFFLNVEGLKWFDALDQREFFAPENNPPPQETTTEGHVLIPHWEILEYLKRTAPELNNQNNKSFAKSFLHILTSVTWYAKENGFSNYRTWSHFADVIQSIPFENLSVEDLEIVDYWLDDPYNTTLVCESIGIRWLPALLNRCDNLSPQLALKLVELLFKIKPYVNSEAPADTDQVGPRVEIELGQEIIDQIATPLGLQLGVRVLPLLETQINLALGQMGNDHSSALWRPAIEEHEQNAVYPKPIDLLIDIYRDTLNAFVEANSGTAVEYISRMLESECVTIKRVAIHAMSINAHIRDSLFGKLLAPTFWTVDYKHELWNLLNQNYRSLSEPLRKLVLKTITTLDISNSEVAPQSRAFWQAEWLAAIKEYGKQEKELYIQRIEEADTEPEHPSFNTYVTAGIVQPKAPISAQQLGAMKTSELVEYLSNFKDDHSNFFESQTRGLHQAFQQVIKSSPLKFSQELSAFDHIGIGYVYQITEAFKDIWIARKSLPWYDVWKSLLQFCTSQVLNDEFWIEQHNFNSTFEMTPNRHWVVGSIASLIETGVKRDDHAFDPKLLVDAEKLINILLCRQKGNSFDNGSGAVSAAIKSPRGSCISALVSLTLRKCRIADKEYDGDHEEVWQHFEKLYNRELGCREPPSYEVATLFANYLPNLQYMSSNWTKTNLDSLFCKEDQKWWRCAMEGYANVASFDKLLYLYLKEGGHLMKVLDDSTIHHTAKDRAIERICIASCREIESLDSDTTLLNIVIARRNRDELNDVVVYLWRLGRINAEYRPKIIAIWQKLLSAIDLNTSEGQNVASQLCVLVEFIEKVDKTTISLVRKIAPYSHVNHNHDYLFEWLEKISESQPRDAHRIWLQMLCESIPPLYPEDSIRKIIENIAKEGYEGEKRVENIANAYVIGGNPLPSAWYGSDT